MSHAVFFDSHKNFFIRAVEPGEMLDTAIEATGHNLPIVLPIIKGMVPVINPQKILEVLQEQHKGKDLFKTRMLYLVDDIQFKLNKTGAHVKT